MALQARNATTTTLDAYLEASGLHNITYLRCILFTQRTHHFLIAVAFGRLGAEGDSGGLMVLAGLAQSLQEGRLAMLSVDIVYSKCIVSVHMVIIL